MVILKTLTYDRIFEFSLDPTMKHVIGGTRKNSLGIPFLAEETIRFEYDGKAWIVTGSADLVVGGKTTRTAVVTLGTDIVFADNKDTIFFICSRDSDNDLHVPINAHQKLSVGRDEKNDLVVRNPRVSRNHFVLKWQEDALYVDRLHSKNGVYLNNKRINRTTKLKDGDRLCFVNYEMLINNGSTTVCNVGEEVILNVDTASNSKEYPFFKRSPRMKQKINTEEFSIDSPPSISGAPAINWITVLLGPFLSVIPMALMTFLYSGEFNLTRIWLMLLMPISGIIIGIINYSSQRRKFKTDANLRETRYDEYLEKKRSEIADTIKIQRGIMQEMNPSVTRCMRMILSGDRRLFERDFFDDDFMSLRVGAGLAKAQIRVRIPHETIQLHEDPLAKKAQKFGEKSNTILDAPILCDLQRFSCCGIVDNTEKGILIVKNMLIQAATVHSYQDLKIIALTGKNEVDDFEFVKWLPHCFSDDRTQRYYADNDYDANRILNIFEEQLKDRETDAMESGFEGSSRAKPYYLFIISDVKYLERRKIQKYLNANNMSLGVGAILICDSIQRLPEKCAWIIETNKTGNVIYNREQADIKSEFSIENTSSDMFETAARRLAPTRIIGLSSTGTIPTGISFLRGYDINVPDEIDIETLWSNAKPYETMSVPIGIDSEGNKEFLDVHESKHGPHGLVAGTTGSGKSEYIQSWILSMALHFSPQQVSFVLIDFKGTGLLLPFEGFPHIAGTISDLDKNINRNLIALENELARRKELLDANGVKNINDYLEKQHRGQATEPLSFLFVIVDEFAEFKVQFPDFMTVIERIFKIGRTLGVFAILLTQKPDGVVSDQIFANTRYKWCFKVASSADSKAMLHRSEASKITNPGRAYFQVGDNEIFDLVQTFWSGAPYSPNLKSAEANAKVFVVNGLGERISYEPERTTGFRSQQSEIDMITKHIDNYVRENGIARAKSIWTKKLPMSFVLERLLTVGFDGNKWNESDVLTQPAVGLIDDPRSQSQYPLIIDLSGHVIVYGSPTSGKTTFLQTMVTALTLTNTPDNVHIYIMDFGNWALNCLAQMPHIGEVVSGDDAEKMEALVRLLENEVIQRKAKFKEMGIGTISAFRSMTEEIMPDIVLMVDNFAPVLNLYPELEDFFISLTREGANYGINVVISTNALNTVHFRISQNIKNLIALHMNDKSDYISIVGRSDVEPEDLPGRGITKIGAPLEFQTALPVEGKDENERLQALRDLAALMKEKWTGNAAKKVRFMPDTVTLDDVDAKGIKLGLSVDTLDPIVLPADHTHYVLISGTASSDVANICDLVAGQLADQGFDVVYHSASYGDSNSQNEKLRIIKTPADFDGFLSELRDVLQKRKEAYAKNKSTRFAPLSVVIDGFDECFAEIADESIAILKGIIQIGKNLGVFLVAGGTAEGLGKLLTQGEQVTLLLSKGKLALALGGKLNDHSFIATDLTYTERDIKVRDGEGYIVIDNQCTRFKLAIK